MHLSNFFVFSLLCWQILRQWLEQRAFYSRLQSYCNSTEIIWIHSVIYTPDWNVPEMETCQNKTTTADLIGGENMQEKDCFHHGSSLMLSLSAAFMWWTESFYGVNSQPDYKRVQPRQSLDQTKKILTFIMIFILTIIIYEFLFSLLQVVQDLHPAALHRHITVSPRPVRATCCL